MRRAGSCMMGKGARAGVGKKMQREPHTQGETLGAAIRSNVGRNKTQKAVKKNGKVQGPRCG